MIPTQLRSVYQFKIKLKNIEQEIWREVLVTSDSSVEVLHYVIQVAMGWCDCHAHCFIAGGGRYGVQDPEAPGFCLDESQVRISQLIKHKNDVLEYHYDFGDEWIHELILEKKLPFEIGGNFPFVIKGVGACPPEDVGGPWGYQELLMHYFDDASPERDNYIDWVGADFDPSFFDMEEANFILQDMFKIRA